MELANDYDFVVLGEHPAGLWAARHFLSLDQKVLILPLGTHSGLNALPRKVAEDFGFSTLDFVNRDEDPIQLLIPGHRFKLGSSLDRLREEYHFHFGHDFSDHELPNSELLRGLLYVSKGSEPGPALPEDWKELAEQVLETVYFEKEPGYLTRIMMKKLAELGAHVAKPGQLKQIFLDRKAFVGVQLVGTSKMIAARNAFACSHFGYLKGFMNEAVDLQSKPMGWNFDIRFECSVDALPVGMSTRMIYIEKDAPILEIIQERPGSFRLRTALPLQDHALERGEERRLAERMLKVCERLIPDLEYNLKWVSPDLRDPERVEAVDLPALYPFQDLNRIPLDRLCYGVGSALGFQCPVSGLYVVSDESSPKSGIWGGYNAVLQALDAIAKKDQRPDFLRLSLKR